MRRVLAVATLLVGQFALARAEASADADDLAKALLRAHKWAASGQVEVTVLFPPRANPTALVRALPVVPFRPGLLVKNFEVVRAGSESMAGRPVKRFDLTPKVGQAAHWTLWVDQVWNVPLGFEERSTGGELARRAVFTQVNAKLQSRLREVPAVPPGLGRAVAQALPGLKLPPGFAATGVKNRQNGGLEVTLTDGVNLLALVIAPRNVKNAPGVASRRVGGQFVWLVGNLPGDVLSGALAQVQPGDLGRLGTFVAPPASNP